jgi:hypothetical protein
MVDSDGLHHALSEEEAECLKAAERIKNGEKVDINNLPIREEYKKKLRKFQEKKGDLSGGEARNDSPLLKILSVGGLLLGLSFILLVLIRKARRRKIKKN